MREVSETGDDSVFTHRCGYFGCIIIIVINTINHILILFLPLSQVRFPFSF